MKEGSTTKKMVFAPEFGSFYEGIDFVYQYLETIDRDNSEAIKALAYCEKKYVERLNHCGCCDDD